MYWRKYIYQYAWMGESWFLLLSSSRIVTAIMIISIHFLLLSPQILLALLVLLLSHIFAVPAFKPLLSLRGKEGCEAKEKVIKVSSSKEDSSWPKRYKVCLNGIHSSFTVTASGWWFRGDRQEAGIFPWKAPYTQLMYETSYIVHRAWNGSERNMGGWYWGAEGKLPC